MLSSRAAADLLNLRVQRESHSLEWSGESWAHLAKRVVEPMLHARLSVLVEKVPASRSKLNLASPRFGFASLSVAKSAKD